MITFKIVLIGDSGVGKTSLAQMLCNRTIDQDLKSTIGADLYVKMLTIDGKQVIAIEEGSKKKIVYNIHLHIYDLAGQIKYAEMRNLYYKGVEGALVVFDIQNEASFNHIPNWLSEISTNTTKPIPIMIVANKVDLVPDDQQKSRIAALNPNIMAALEEINLHNIVTTSATQGLGVPNVFQAIATRILKKRLSMKKPTGLP